MRPQVTLDQALLGLANLLNQSSVPSAESARWQFFTVSAVERLYRAFDHDTAKRTATVTSDENGKISLDAIADKLGPMPAIESLTDAYDTYPLTFIMTENQRQYVQGDRRWWQTLDNSTPAKWVLYTTEPNGTFTLEYYEAPAISNAQAACFTKMVIAKGALIYYRQAQDPEADTSVEEDQFKQEVAEVMEQQNRRRPQQFAYTQRDVTGRTLGATD